jgi:hypothetical protein
MEPTRPDSTMLDAPVRLSWRQKFDLLAQAFAAIITTGLIAAPILGPSLTAERPLAARPMSQLTMVVPEMDRPSLAVALPPVAPRSRAARVVPATVTVPAPEPEPAPQAVPSRERRPFGRRVATLFTGSGAYTIRPFPTVPEER